MKRIVLFVAFLASAFMVITPASAGFLVPAAFSAMGIAASATVVGAISFGVNAAIPCCGMIAVKLMRAANVSK